MDAFIRYYSSLEVASEYFRSGADKVSIGSDAVYAAEEYLKSGVCKVLLDAYLHFRPVYSAFLVTCVLTLQMFFPPFLFLFCCSR